MTEHTHRYTYMGLGWHVCQCGDQRHDGRTPEQIAADRERSTIAAKVRINAAMGVDSPNLRAALAKMGR